MKQFLNSLLIALVFILVGWFANTAYNLPKNVSDGSKVLPTPLAKYSIENLAHTYVNPTDIEIGKQIKSTQKYSSYEFSMLYDPTLTNGPVKKVTGLINVPAGQGPFPSVIMFRGYIDPTIYTTGSGTLRAGEYFAENGFITVAPDFLGYGGSDKESEDIFETRFQTYTTAITLIKSVEALKVKSLKAGSKDIKLDVNNIFIWGHSNGGQIALTALEITGVNYPTVLWAPVSKPFPFTVLYYTDEATDGGKYLRKETASFESIYDSNLFTLTNYLKLIKAPIQLNQGTNDDAVPVSWSDTLDKNLTDMGIRVDYNKYEGADHNLMPAWSQVATNSLNFYKNFLK